MGLKFGGLALGFGVERNLGDAAMLVHCVLSSDDIVEKK